MAERKKAYFYLSLLGLLTLGGFWRPEFLAFAPFLAFGELESDRRWMRILARISLVGFGGSLAILLRLLRPHL